MRIFGVVQTQAARKRAHINVRLGIEHRPGPGSTIVPVDVGIGDAKVHGGVDVARAGDGVGQFLVIANCVSQCHFAEHAGG
jgi:hypothetical protein